MIALEMIPQQCGQILYLIHYTVMTSDNAEVKTVSFRLMKNVKTFFIIYLTELDMFLRGERLEQGRKWMWELTLPTENTE
jgi:hypothetical protein